MAKHAKTGLDRGIFGRTSVAIGSGRGDVYQHFSCMWGTGVVFLGQITKTHRAVDVHTGILLHGLYILLHELTQKYMCHKINYKTNIYENTHKLK